MVRQYHQLNGHESEQTPGDSEGQGSLVCCSPWGDKELDMTQQPNNNNKSVSYISILISQFSSPTPVPLGIHILVLYICVCISALQIRSSIPLFQIPPLHILHNLFVCVLVAHSCLTLRSHGLQLTRLLYPWSFPDSNTGVGCHSLLQGIFPMQGLFLGLPHCRQMPYQ